MKFGSSRIVIFASIFTLSSTLSILNKLSSLSGASPENSNPTLENLNSSEDGGAFNGVYTNPNLVGFYLYYNPQDLSAYDNILFQNLDSIINSHYDASKKTKFLIHGFTQNGTSSFPINVKNAYLTHTGSKFNIIAVDWGKLSSPEKLYPLFYRLAVSNVPKVGKKVGQFILFLKENMYITEDSVHLVGFSLGAHVASNAGDYIQKQSGVKIARISGLDPAGPAFAIEGPSVKRLDPSDAKFVDVIHTNAGLMGYPGNLGHVDFYPNGGSFQPTCRIKTPSLLQLKKDDMIGAVSGSCSHGKAPVYFAMSLDPKQIPNIAGCNCETYASYRLACGKLCEITSGFGEYVDLTTRGTYYVDIIPVEDKELENSNV